MKVSRAFCGLFLCQLIATSIALAQTTTQSILETLSEAFSKGHPVHSVTLEATAEWTAGSDIESGNAKLVASADGSSSLQLELSHSSRTENQTSFASGQSCNWTGTDGVVHQAASHNCMTSFAWFMPAVTLLGGHQAASINSALVSTAGQQFIDLRQQQTPATGRGSGSAALLAHLTTTDLYIDPATHLPSALTYQVHPDANASADIPVEVIFSNYQVVDGVAIPYRIQRYFNGSLNLDLTVTQASAD